MVAKNFFLPMYFSPAASKIFAKFAKIKGDISFRMYESEGIIQYEIPGFVIFLPNSVLASGYRFGKIENHKRLILQLHLTEEDLIKLIRMLKGSIKRISLPPPSPTLGDLLKL